MANDNVVYSVNGATHDPQLFREQAWINSGGQTGVVGPGSLEVLAQPTPGGSVRVLPGGFSIAATPGGTAGYTDAPWQSYAKALYQTSTVEIRPTGSSGPRVDVVGIVINDPQFEGTAESMSDEELEAHQFWSFHVIENAPASTTTAAGFGLPRPFLPLARINIPANTATITNAYITDLRFLAVRRTQTDIYTYTPNRVRSMTGPGEFTETVDREIPIPQWATRLVVHGAINGMALTGTPSTDVSGNARAMIVVGDGSVSSNVFELEATQFYELDQPRFNRITIPISGIWNIPASRRGQNLRIFWRINMTNRPGTLTFFETGARFDLTLHFEESPVGVNS